MLPVIVITFTVVVLHSPYISACMNVTNFSFAYDLVIVRKVSVVKEYRDSRRLYCLLILFQTKKNIFQSKPKS